MVGPAAKCAAVAHLQAVMSLSERRACSIVGADRKMVRYRSSENGSFNTHDPAARQLNVPAISLNSPATPAIFAGQKSSHGWHTRM